MFLDLTGTSRLFGPACDTAARIEREMARQNGLAGVVGVANTKLVSGIAGKLIAPLQLCEVRSGAEQAFLATVCRAAIRLEKEGALDTIRRTDDFRIIVADHDERPEVSLKRLEQFAG